MATFNIVIFAITQSLLYPHVLGREFDDLNDYGEVWEGVGAHWDPTPTAPEPSAWRQDWPNWWCSNITSYIYGSGQLFCVNLCHSTNCYQLSMNIASLFVLKDPNKVSNFLYTLHSTKVATQLQPTMYYFTLENINKNRTNRMNISGETRRITMRSQPQ